MKKARTYLTAHAPRVIPPLSAMLADLGSPSACDLAALLHVHPRTVERWTATDCAPRPALLALFWLTRWGRSAIEAQAVNDAAHAARLARLAQLEADRLRKQNAHLVRVGDFGAANDAADAG